jgi:hypothetical protein
LRIEQQTPKSVGKRAPISPVDTTPAIDTTEPAGRVRVIDFFHGGGRFDIASQRPVQRFLQLRSIQASHVGAVRTPVLRARTVA